jgi:hypothetical protein
MGLFKKLFGKKPEKPVELKLTLNFPAGLTIHVKHHGHKERSAPEAALRPGSADPAGKPLVDSPAGANPEDIGIDPGTFIDQEIPEVPFGQESSGDQDK